MDKNVENDLMKKVNEVHRFLLGGGTGPLKNMCLREQTISAEFALLTVR